MYTLNPEAARAGDVVGAFLNDTGKYVGRFTRAEKLVARDKGTHGIGFSFKANDGRETRFDIWTQKADGTTLPGLNTVNALMTCLQLRELKDSPQRVKKYDFDLQKDVEATVPCFAGLMNTDIGLLLRAEEYEKMQDGHPTGQTGWRMNVFAVFQAVSELMATEILARKTTAYMLALVEPALKDKPLRKKNAPTNGSASQPSALAAAGFPDDDVPF